MKDIIKWILFLLFLSACAIGPEYESSISDDEFVQVFNLDKKELDNFRVIKTEKSFLIDKTSKKKSKKKLTIKKELAKHKKGKVSKKDILMAYPKDYPENFKKYDIKSKKIWEEFKFTMIEGEEFVFNVRYFGVFAGQVTMTTMPMVQIDGKVAYHLRARFKTARYYSYIYFIDDYLDSFIDQKTFRPIKYTFVQRESGQVVDDLQLFHHDKYKTHFLYKKVKKGKTTKKNITAFIPRYFQDSFSALFFVRGLPLIKGDVYQFPVVTKSKIKMLRIVVCQDEKIEIDGKEVMAIKINASAFLPGVLKKKGEIIFWYSKDDRRSLLKFSAKVKIGTVKGVLEKYNF